MFSVQVPSDLVPSYLSHLTSQLLLPSLTGPVSLPTKDARVQFHICSWPHYSFAQIISFTFHLPECYVSLKTVPFRLSPESTYYYKTTKTSLASFSSKSLKMPENSRSPPEDADSIYCKVGISLFMTTENYSCPPILKK